MDDEAEGQVTAEAAQVYEDCFVPALFGPWAHRAADAARIEPGQDVLDVACGTGVLAREVAGRVGPEGTVEGVDVNEGMLAVARRKAPEITWRQGRAESLPYPDERFDAVLCQFGLMFFEDPPRAIAEMWRVLRPGGAMVVVVWDGLDRTPGYRAMTDLLERLFGTQAARAMEIPFQMGDREDLRASFLEAGVQDPQLQTIEGEARYPSLEDWIHVEIRGWTLAETIDDEGYRTLLERAEDELDAFVEPDGTVAFPMPAHVVTAWK